MKNITLSLVSPNTFFLHPVPFLSCFLPADDEIATARRGERVTGVRVAMRNASGWKRYYFADHLGTAGLIVTQNGTVQRQAQHTPYGQLRWESGNNPTEQEWDFTGQRLDGFEQLD